MKNYKNPPIVEAIFTVYFRELISKDTIEKFKNLEFINLQYPKNFENVSVNVKVSPNTEIEKNVYSDGYLFNSEKNKLLNLKYSHLSFHSLEKYDGWENEIYYLFEALNHLNEIDNSITIKDISCRYLNKIILPEDFKNDLSKYLVVFPSIPRSIDSSGPFHLSFKTKNGDINGTIIESLEYINNENVLVVDISVDNSVDNLNYKTKFEELHQYKNLLFQNLLRLETKNLFN